MIKTNHLPLPYKSHYLPIDSLSNRIHYISEGQGETILCIHGNPTWSFYFRHVVQGLKQTHHVIAYDHIGSGLSTKPQQYNYSLQQHIDNLDQFINKLKLKELTILVHDWGGAIGLGWATKNRHKVKRIIITNTAAYLCKDIPKRIALLKTPFIGELLIRQFNVFSKSALFMASYNKLSKEAKKGLLHPYNSFKNRIGIARFVQDIPIKKTHPSYHVLANIEEQLPQLKSPTLILWGMHDFCFHQGFLKKWQSIYPSARTVTYHKASHYLFEDVPNEINTEIKTFMSQS